MKITTKVIELEPAWLLIRFDGQKPPADKRAFWLSRTLTDWLGSHTGRVVTRTLPILHEGELLAVHVWLDSAPAPTPMRAFPLKVEKQVFESIHKEHLEAFLQQAYEAFFGRSKISSLAVISRGGLAAVFDHVAERALLVSVDDLRADERTNVRIKTWLAAPDSSFLVVDIDSPGLK